MRPRLESIGFEALHRGFWISQSGELVGGIRCTGYMELLIMQCKVDIHCFIYSHKCQLWDLYDDGFGHVRAFGIPGAHFLLLRFLAFSMLHGHLDIQVSCG